MPRPTIAVLTTAVLALVTQSGVPAVALGSSATAGITAISTGTWAVTPLASASALNTGTALVINSLNTRKNSYFWVRNFGTYAVNAFAVGQVVAQTGRSPSVEIRACSGVWDVTRDTCSGVITTLLSTGDGQSGSVTAQISIPSGEAIQLAAFPTRNGMSTSVSTSVDRSAIRPPQVSRQ